MNLLVYKNIFDFILRSVKIDPKYIKKSIYLFLISFYATFSFFLEFKPISSFFTFIKLPSLYFIAGIVFTSIPYYFLFFISFFPAKYIIPIYYLAFIYMFII